MKNTVKLLLFVLFAVLAFTPAASAQTTVVQTTLSAAITASDTSSFSVASSASITASTASAQTYCMVDKELIRVRAIPVSGVLTGTRGDGSTVAAPHVNASVVTCGPAGNWDARTGVSSGVFVRTVPQSGTPCVAANQGFTFIVSAVDGVFARCNGTSLKWETASTKADVTHRPTVNGGNANYTATLFDYHIHYNATTTGRTVTLPSVTNDFGTELVVSQFTTGAGQTITITGVNGQNIGPALSTTVTTSGGSLRLISIGGAWATID